MITEILKDRTADQKPRFFLHDEMTAWLSDNLEVRSVLVPHHVTDYSLVNGLQKINIYNQLVGGVTTETTVYIGGQPIIGKHGSTVSMMANIEVFYKLLEHREQQEQLIASLVNKISFMQTELSACMNEISQLKQKP
jgi:hypothetical protein